MGSGLVRIDTTRQESSFGLSIKIRPDPEGTVPIKKRPVPFFVFLLFQEMSETSIFSLLIISFKVVGLTPKRMAAFF